MIHPRLLLWIIAIVGGVFLALTIVIVCNKAWRETRARRRRARWWALEPKILAWVHGEGRSVLLAFPGGVGPRDRVVVEQILLAHVQRVRGTARERFREALDQLGFVDDYLHELHSARWWFRARAGERLGAAGSARAVDPLIAALEDDTVEVRIRAAKALGAVGGAAAIRSLTKALEEPTRWSTLRIADILSEMGPEVVQELIEPFPRMAPPAKVAVLDILARVRALSVAPWIREKLAEADADVRARAANALGSLGDAESGPALREALHDPEWPVRAMAAKALGRVRHAEAVPDLCEALRDREWWVRSNAAKALRDLGSAGQDALVWMLEDADPFARQQAVLMLEEAGLLDEKVDLLARTDPGTRNTALALIRRFIEAGQVWRLHELAASHPEPKVRHALRAEFEANEVPEQ